MQKVQAPDHSLPQQIKNFIIHLRWHYQVFILSGGFLLGGFLSGSVSWTDYGIQFLNVHLLLFGGATAYNSYWDKDDGPVGGLKNPPEMNRWMWGASLLLQAIGLVIAFQTGVVFTVIYLISVLFFWLYSSPLFRWKGAPIKSLVAIGISTGINAVLMGYLAAGGAITSSIWSAAVGTALIVLSLYPVSQLYQLDEDIERGDQTFAVKFGFVGVMHFFIVAFWGGILLISLSLLLAEKWLGASFLLTGSIVGGWVFYRLKNLTSERDGYHSIMQIKYRTSLAFVTFLLISLLLRHSIIEIL